MDYRDYQIFYTRTFLNRDGLREKRHIHWYIYQFLAEVALDIFLIYHIIQQYRNFVLGHGLRTIYILMNLNYLSITISIISLNRY